MGGPERAPKPPVCSGRPGEAVAALDVLDTFLGQARARGAASAASVARAHGSSSDGAGA